MHRKVGDLVIINDVAIRDMIIRHLILPENLAGSDRVIPGLQRIYHATHMSLAWTSFIRNGMHGMTGFLLFTHRSASCIPSEEYCYE